MAVLTPASFFSKWTSRIADNNTREISEEDVREFAEDIKDSFQSVLGGTVITSWKDPVVVATTANIALTGEQTIDGVLTSASRILVRAQSTTSQNGIYVSAAGAWSRSTDADAASELEGAAVGVTQGTLYANTVWLQTTDTITLGVSAIAWQQIGFGVSSQNLTQVLTQGNDGGGLSIDYISAITLGNTTSLSGDRSINAESNDGQAGFVFNTMNTTVGERFKMTYDGRLYGKNLHNNSGSVTGTTDQYIASGTYTPTLTNVTNIASSTAHVCQYMRVGNVVTVSGLVDLTPTAGAPTNSEIDISFPIASNIANGFEVAGTGVGNSAGGTDHYGSVTGVVASDRAALSFKSTTTGAMGFTFHFTYLIL